MAHWRLPEPQAGLDVRRAACTQLCRLSQAWAQCNPGGSLQGVNLARDAHIALQCRWAKQLNSQGTRLICSRLHLSSRLVTMIEKCAD